MDVGRLFPLPGFVGILEFTTESEWPNFWGRPSGKKVQPLEKKYPLFPPPCQPLEKKIQYHPLFFLVKHFLDTPKNHVSNFQSQVPKAPPVPPIPSKRTEE